MAAIASGGYAELWDGPNYGGVLLRALSPGARGSSNSETQRFGVSLMFIV